MSQYKAVTNPMYPCIYYVYRRRFFFFWERIGSVDYYSDSTESLDTKVRYLVESVKEYRFEA
jgi:hypothetical protein